MRCAFVVRSAALEARSPEEQSRHRSCRGAGLPVAALLSYVDVADIDDDRFALTRDGSSLLEEQPVARVEEVLSRLPKFAR